MSDETQPEVLTLEQQATRDRKVAVERLQPIDALLSDYFLEQLEAIFKPKEK